MILILLWNRHPACFCSLYFSRAGCPSHLVKLIQQIALWNRHPACFCSLYFSRAGCPSHLVKLIQQIALWNRHPACFYSLYFCISRMPIPLSKSNSTNSHLVRTYAKVLSVEFKNYCTIVLNTIYSVSA